MSKTATLNDVCSFLSGNAWPAKGFSKTGSVPVIRIQNLSNETNDFVYWNDKYDERFLINKGDLLLGLSGSIKVDYWSGPVALLNQRIVKIVEMQGVSRKWLFWLISSVLRKIENIGKHALVNNVSLTDLRSFPISFPSLPVQERIAAILDEADALRKKDAALLQKYDELLQSIFYDMFGEYIDQSDKGEFRLSDIAEIVSGVAKNTGAVKPDYIDVPYMRVANVQDGHIDLTEVKYIKVSQKDFDKYLLRVNDILLTEGGDPDKLGRGAVWQGEIHPCIHQNHIFRVRINRQDTTPIFLSHLLASRYGKAYFLKAAKQTTGIASINMTQLKNFKVVIPPIELQNQFSEIVKSIESQKQTILTHQAQSEALFQSLMQRAFKGELVG